MIFVSLIDTNLVHFVENGAFFAELFSDQPNKTLEEIAIASHAIDRPRGLCPNDDGSVSVAGFDAFSTLKYSKKINRVIEGDAVIVGRNNHDVLKDEDGSDMVVVSVPIRVLDLSRGTQKLSKLTPRVQGSRRSRREIRNFPENADNGPYLINTTSKDGKCFTYLRGRKSGEKQEDRVLDDGVILNGNKITLPGIQWSSPHHPEQAGNKDWWVCNSGEGQLVNLASGERISVGGFPRSLRWQNINGKRGFFFTKSIAKKERAEDEKTGQICFIDLKTKQVSSIDLQYSSSPYMVEFTET